MKEVFVFNTTSMEFPAEAGEDVTVLPFTLGFNDRLGGLVAIEISWVDWEGEDRTARPDIQLPPDGATVWLPCWVSAKVFLLAQERWTVHLFDTVAPGQIIRGLDTEIQEVVML